MLRRKLGRARVANWFALLLAGLLLFSSVPAAAATNDVSRVQPILLEMARAKPEEPIAVIIQKIGDAKGIESLIQRLGGRVTSDLWLINAIAAELPAGEISRVGQAEGVRWISYDAPTVNSALTSVTNPTFTTWATNMEPRSGMDFVDTDNLVNEGGLGPDGLYSRGSSMRAAFSGFAYDVTPDHAVDTVEIALHGFVQKATDQDLKVIVQVGSDWKSAFSVQGNVFDSVVGRKNTGQLYIDLTSLRDWTWADLEAGVLIELRQDLQGVDAYYDAVGLRVSASPIGGIVEDPAVISLEPVKDPLPVIQLPPESYEAISTSNLANAYNYAVRATDVWNEAPKYLQGQGVTVAIVDSGIGLNKELYERTLASINFSRDYFNATDLYGHGTFVAGIIAGNGWNSNGERIGIAPKTNLLSLRVSNEMGMSYESDVIDALQWLFKNKDLYNVRVVNLSFNSSVQQSYRTSPMSIAVELLWFNGVVVVTSAGNNGSAQLYPPANDPYVITVGATDDRATVTLDDDIVAGFSAYGVTADGYSKPELVAPGTNIVGYLPGDLLIILRMLFGNHVVDYDYFRMSGTSMSAPIVSGAVALLVQDEPDLTPDQVKHRLMATANRNWPNYSQMYAGAGYLDVHAAVYGTTTEEANSGIVPTDVLAKMALIAAWAGASGDSINWESVNWDSVNWDSVNWDSVNWDSVNWDSVNWDSVNWDSVNWDSVNWDSVNWDSVNWDSVNWDSVNWDSLKSIQAAGGGAAGIVVGYGGDHWDDLTFDADQLSVKADEAQPEHNGQPDRLPEPEEQTQIFLPVIRQD